MSEETNKIHGTSGGTGSAEEAFKQIQGLVEKAMKDNFSNSTSDAWPYTDINDYKAKTGKKFRTKKDQVNRGLTREQAFAEYMDELVNK